MPPKKESGLKLEFQEDMKETGIYPVKRTLNGEEDKLNFFFFSKADLAEAREYAREKKEEEAENNDNPEP